MTETTQTRNNLYRIASFDRVVSILKDKQMFFARPSSWEDPHETVLDHPSAKKIFAQCWCMKSTSDAMWRIYSPDTLGVRIGTTRARLKAELETAKKAKIVRYMMRDVAYHEPAKFRAEIKAARAALADDARLETAASTLFLKRAAFSHEDEVRVVANSRTEVADDAKGMFVPVDPSRLIRSILFDSRAKQAFVDAFTHYIQDELGFEGEIGRSVLYDQPKRNAR
jgi:hypothetical protein